MQAAFHIVTRVLPGNKIEIQLPEGTIGKEIEAIVLLPEKAQIPKRSALEILADAHRLRSFRTPEEIDQYIQDEKNSWDS
ncbi:MAG: hypothetical protein HC833_15715 [Leptolyngbyaceae cyanobacterium RM1_406_9]|nr:hypothetical protein [Leptolyngbyaceae cyanobacterium RM1_406_9]